MFEDGHLDGDVLEQYAMGALSEAASETLEEHILICEVCQNRLEETETYVRSMRGALQKLEQERREHPILDWLRGLFGMPSIAWGATAVAGCAAVVLLAAIFRTGGGPPVAVALSATRGASAVISATGPIDLDLDAEGLPETSYHLEVVDANGKSVWTQPSAAWEKGQIRARIGRRLGRGQYFVRAIPSGGASPREYSLEIK